MARIQVERAHTLGKDAARVKADKLASKLKEQYGLESSWAGDTLNLKRSGVKGTVKVAEDSLRIEVELGLLMSAMSGTIKSEIEKALDKALA
ncbi:polyhydroxyalkanoic acid system family protein [Pseudomonas sp. G5001]|uniref:polyhydroxyalkanoic acid system family protein n=1 Tax=unclassified Pseudomonas TaxID=196821 RepID=UPI0015A170FA|nr:MULTISPECIES: polyhydroxyalkanoic acid system family protein [unclassified Pseudomonas]MBT1269110.1 polyhydroxyalkanoic acid system family protein [Pseudomonas sp. VS38]NWB72031.1 polyhydroxyalkanoic acid system family protein [Pseudomonas sp. G5001]